MKNLSTLVIVGVVIIFGLYGCNGYNNLVGLDENVKGKWSVVETDYQRRADLIPNLVKTVQGAADFERGTLTDVIEARAKATAINLTADDLTPENLAKFQSAQDQLSGSLSRLLVAVERYPDLKTNQNFLELQAQLEGTENRIAVSRKDFNAAVQGFNQQVRVFPTNILANIFGFDPKAYFGAAEGADKAPDVDFDFK